MKITIFNSSAKRTMAIAAISVLASTWTGAASAKTLGIEYSGGWVARSTPSTRAAFRSLFWGDGWKKCRAKYPATRSIYVYEWSVETVTATQKAISGMWGCSDSKTAPPDAGPVKAPADFW